MVWGDMSFTGLKELHIVPQKQFVDKEYYCNEILEGNLFPRKRKNAAGGSKFGFKLVPQMSEMIFHEDGALAHTALRTQELLQEKILNFWSKDMWPTNSPDLNPIENLWAILGDKVDEEKVQPTTIAGLENFLKTSW